MRHWFVLYRWVGFGHFRRAYAQPIRGYRTSARPATSDAKTRMTIPTLKRLLGTATLALALAACSDTTGSGDNPPGAVSFTYTGTDTGDFAASGAFDPDANELSDYAVASVLGGQLVIIASDTLGTGRSNLFAIYVPPVTGVTTCTATTAPASCRIGGEFLTEVSSNPNEGFGHSYVGSVGTVEVTELANNRVRGTFSITLESENSESQVEIRAGTFDVPVVSSRQFNPNRNRFPAAAPPIFNRTR